MSLKSWSKQLWIFILQMKRRGVTPPWDFECFRPKGKSVSSSLVLMMIRGKASQPDPSVVCISWRRGALIGSDHQKKILTFFKEVPREEFSNDGEFAEWVRQKKEYLLDRYFSEFFFFQLFFVCVCIK